MALPLGTLAAGYQMMGGSPVEMSTPNGMEVRATYIGPSENRFNFLSYLMGDWTISASSLGIPCSAVANNIPKCYRFFEYGTPGYGGSCWPDTFSIRPLDDPSPVYTQTAGAGTNPESWCISYDCASEITVNYRTKMMAEYYGPGTYVSPWPPGMMRCETGGSSQLPCYSVPYVTPWTSVTVREESNTDVQLIPYRHLQWDTDEPGFPTGVSPMLTEEDVSGFPVQVQTTNIEIEWSGVPIPDWEAIDYLKGKLNNGAMWGYPDESIMFANCTPEVQRRWDNLDIWTLRYQLIAKIVEAWMPPQTGSTDDPATQPNCFNTMGYWNRKWSKYPVIDTSTSKESPFRLVRSVEDADRRPYAKGNLTELFRVKGDTLDPLAG